MTIKDTVKLMTMVQMNRMKILNGLSSSLQIAISRGWMLREHGMRVDTRWKDGMVIDAELGVLAKIRVLVAGMPIVKDTTAGRALKGLDLVFNVEIDSGVEHLGDQRVVIAGNLVE